MSNVMYAFKHLIQAELEKNVVAPLTDVFPNLSVEEAYQVQMKWVDYKVREGQRIVGKKIGLTSVAMQKLLGVDQPDYGHLLNGMELKDGEKIDMNRLYQPKIEAEIAFILYKDLKGPSVTIEDVIEATEYILPALEIVDSRISDWKIKLPDTIADNASSGFYLLGKEKYLINDVDLRTVKMDLYKNGEKINTGYGSEVLGHPAKCVAWLANKLGEYNVGLKAGEVILSGALSAALIAEKGDRFVADFSQLGKIEVEFN